MKERLKLKIWKAYNKNEEKALATYGVNKVMAVRPTAWALHSDDVYYFRSVNGGAIRKRKYDKEP